jgi:regulator of sigma E protease
MDFFGTAFDWLLALFLFGLLLFVHELGHFLMARITGVKVEEFGFGFPPRLLKMFTWQGTLVSLNVIPFGGFVKPAGEDDPNVEGGLAASSKRIRVLVLLGGVVLNAATAVAAYTIAFKVAFPEGAVIQVVEPETPIAAAGLQPGDVIYSVGGAVVRNITEVSQEIRGHLGESITLGFFRDGLEMEADVVPRETWPEDQGPTGMVIADSVSGSHGWDEAVGESFRTIADQIQLILQFPAMILRGQFNPATDRPVGPVGILDVTGQIVGVAREYGHWIIILNWIGFVSLALAIGNLLPIPALDGGRLLFVFLEAVRGKRIDPEKERMVNGYSMLVLLGLMVIITWLDLFFPVLPR